MQVACHEIKKTKIDEKVGPAVVGRRTVFVESGDPHCFEQPNLHDAVRGRKKPHEKVPQLHAKAPFQKLWARMFCHGKMRKVLNLPQRSKELNHLRFW